MNLAHPKSRVPELRALMSRATAADSQNAPFFVQWWKRLGRLVDAYEDAALAPTAFSAVLPLTTLTHAEQSQFLERVAKLNESSSPLRTTPGMCRIQLRLRSATESSPHGALVVDCTHQRDREDLLYELFEQHDEALDPVLQHCRDYPGSEVRDACVRMLMRAARERKVTSPQPPCAPVPLGTLPPLHDFEHKVADERGWLERAALHSRTSSRKKTREARRKDPDAPAQRGVHPKHHGLLQAKFKVHPNLSQELICGVFQPGASYDAWIRLSNMGREVKPDIERDARGFAIKLDDVRASDEIPEWQVGAWSGQDFLLASHPVFIVKDLRDYTLFQRIWDDKLSLRKIVFLGRRLSELKTLVKAQRRGIDHALNIEYYSMIPYAFGPKIVRYVVRPAPKLAHVPVEKNPSPDYLRERLQRTLDLKAGHPVTLEFCLVVPTNTHPSVEDARADWKPSHFRIEPVATIEIQPQDFSDIERMKLAESIEFTPWHTLRVHRPLGSLSRARLAVYRESAGHRRHANPSATVAPA